MQRSSASAILVLAVASAILFCAQPAHAQRQASYVPVYDQLLPDGVTPEVAPDGVFANLSGKTIVVVPSTNFNTYVGAWTDFYGRGPPQPWVSENNMTVARHATDPRHLTDRVMTALQPHFADVQVASDLAEARDMGADYIAVIDYWTIWRPWAMRQRTRAGVHVLDVQLRQVMAIENQVDVPLVQSMSLSIDRAWENSAQMMTNSLNQSTEPVLESLQQHLAAAE
jgi:hypothetical protein